MLGAFEPLRVPAAGGHLPRRALSAPGLGLRGRSLATRCGSRVPGAGAGDSRICVTAAPAGSSGNFALGGFDPQRGTGYVMYQISGGGYGGNAQHDGLTNGCSTIGISKTALRSR